MRVDIQRLEEILESVRTRSVFSVRMHCMCGGGACNEATYSPDVRKSSSVDDNNYYIFSYPPFITLINVGDRWLAYTDWGDNQDRSNGVEQRIEDFINNTLHAQRMSKTFMYGIAHDNWTLAEAVLSSQDN